MEKALKFCFLFFFFFFILQANSAAAQSGCARTFSGNRAFQLCTVLPVLGSSLSFTHDPQASILRLAFSAAPPAAGGWISWGINPNGLSMIGTQALLAFRSANGSIDVDTYNISSYRTVTKSKISYEVTDLAAEFGSDGVATIFAALKLPPGTTKVNQVWQVGASVTDGVPVRHSFDPDNLASRSALDLAAGVSVPSGRSSSRRRKANIHGILNGIGWGILIPIGGIIARYVKTFKSADPAWFYLHVACQLSGYAVGVAGWATGLQLGAGSKGIVRTYHRNVGISIFSLATLQIFALFLRPNKQHKYRPFWNAYHHAVGYAVIILGVINIFEGFSILNRAYAWKSAYIAVIASLGGVAVLLEVVTWVIYFRSKANGKNLPVSE